MRLTTGVLCVLVAVVATGAWNPSVPRTATVSDSAPVAASHSARNAVDMAHSGPGQDRERPGGGTWERSAAVPLRSSAVPNRSAGVPPVRLAAAFDADPPSPVSDDDTPGIVIGLGVVMIAGLATMVVAIWRTSGPGSCRAAAEESPSGARAPRRGPWWGRWSRGLVRRRRPESVPEPTGNPAVEPTDDRADDLTDVLADEPAVAPGADARAEDRADDRTRDRAAERAAEWKAEWKAEWGADDLAVEPVDEPVDDRGAPEAGKGPPPEDVPTRKVYQRTPGRAPVVRTPSSVAGVAGGGGARRRAYVRTALHPEGYVEMDDCLHRVEWAAADAVPPPAVGDLVEVVVHDSGALLAYPLAAGPLERRPST